MRKVLIMILATVLFTSSCALLPSSAQTDSQLAALQVDYERLEGKYEDLLSKIDGQDKKMLQDKETIRDLKDEIKLLKDQGNNSDQIDELLATITELQEEIDYLRANPPVCENIVLTQAEIENLLYMDMAAILDFFGDDYIYGSVADGVPAYIYDTYFLVFDDDNLIELIDLQVVEIEGYEISLGLTFDDVQEYLGYTDVYEIEQVMPDDPSFVLVYNFGDYYLWLGSDEVDGMITHIRIRYF